MTVLQAELRAIASRLVMLEFMLDLRRLERQLPSSPIDPAEGLATWRCSAACRQNNGHAPTQPCLWKAARHAVRAGGWDPKLWKTPPSTAALLAAVEMRSRSTSVCIQMERESRSSGTWSLRCGLDQTIKKSEHV